MDHEDNVKIEIQVPLLTKRLAEIAYHVLRVDKEPKRSGVTKDISYKDNLLQVNFTGQLARQVRVAVNAFFESLNLICETAEFTGEPYSDNYTHF